MKLSTLEQIGHGLGSVSEAFGTALFEHQLAQFLGTAVRHDMMTMTRYSLVAPPAFLAHTESYPRELAERYLKHYHLFDPFAAYWRETRQPGVVSLSDLSSGQRKLDRYIREILPESGIADEMGIFLPPLAGASLAFFFERVERRFSKSDRDLLAALYPLVANLYRAHLAVIFNTPQQDHAPSPTTQHAMLLTDHTGQPVWTTKAWADLSADARNQIKAVLATGAGPDLKITDLGGGYSLLSEPLNTGSGGSDGQSLWVVEAASRPVTDQDPLAVGVWDFDALLSPRERQIVQLILKGYPTTSIAQKLGLSRGTVKNHRRRIYDKLDITSERELFLMYIEAAIGTVG